MAPQAPVLASDGIICVRRYIAADNVLINIVVDKMLAYNHVTKSLHPGDPIFFSSFSTATSGIGDELHKPFFSKCKQLIKKIMVEINSSQNFLSNAYIASPNLPKKA